MKFYVYELQYPDGRVFYVGMGTGLRVKQHEIKATKDDKSHKSRVIRLIWSRGERVVSEIVARFETRVEAMAHEVRLIAKYGRRDVGTGVLVNKTDGGEGVRGSHHSEESKARISAALRGKPRPQHVIAAVTAANRGRTPSEETRARMSAAWSPERKAEHVRRCKAREVSAHQREAISRANRGRKKDPLLVERIAAKLRGRTQTEEQKRKSGAAISRSWTPERRAAQAIRMSAARRSGAI